MIATQTAADLVFHKDYKEGTVYAIIYSGNGRKHFTMDKSITAVDDILKNLNHTERTHFISISDQFSGKVRTYASDSDKKIDEYYNAIFNVKKSGAAVGRRHALNPDVKQYPEDVDMDAVAIEEEEADIEVQEQVIRENPSDFGVSAPAPAPKKRYRLDIDIGAGGAAPELPMMDASLNREYERLVADIVKKDDKIEKQAIEITKKSAENDKLTTKNEAMKEIKAQNERLTLENKALIDVAKSGSNPEIHRRSDEITQCMLKGAQYERLKETSAKREIEQEERFKNKYNTLEKEHEARYNGLLKEFEDFKRQHATSDILKIELQHEKELNAKLQTDYASLDANFKAKMAAWDETKANMETKLDLERDKCDAAREKLKEAEVKVARLDKNDTLQENEKLKSDLEAVEPRIKAANDRVKVLEASLAESKKQHEYVTVIHKELYQRTRQHEEKVIEHQRAKAGAIKENEHLKKVIADLEAKATAQAKQNHTQLSENSQLKDKIKQLEELNASGEITVGWATEAKATIATLQEVCTIIISRCCGL
jgi:hypothetical protein